MEEKNLKELFELCMATSNFFKMFIFKKNKNNDQCTLSMNQALCLNVICLKKITNMTAIAKDVGISNQQLTRVIDDLVEKGYIIREKNPDNQRQIIAKPTPLANEFYKKMFKNLEDRFYSVFNQIDPVKIQELINHLREIDKVLNEVKSSINNESTK